MEQLSITGNWALCQVEPTIHPLIKVLLLSHCTLISITAARLIYHQLPDCLRRNEKLISNLLWMYPLRPVSSLFFALSVQLPWRTRAETLALQLTIQARSRCNRATTAKKCTKKRDALVVLLIKPIPFCRSRCRRRHRCLSSLILARDELRLRFSVGRFTA